MDFREDKDYRHFKSYASCHVIATALSAEYGHPIVGVWADVGSGDIEWEEGEEDFLSLVHAFCSVGDGVAVDIDGKKSREDLVADYWEDEADADEVTEFDSLLSFADRVEIDQAELRRAREFVRRYPEVYGR